MFSAARAMLRIILRVLLLTLVASSAQPKCSYTVGEAKYVTSARAVSNLIVPHPTLNVAADCKPSTCGKDRMLRRQTFAQTAPNMIALFSAPAVTAAAAKYPLKGFAPLLPYGTIHCTHRTRVPHRERERERERESILKGIHRQSLPKHHTRVTVCSNKEQVKTGPKRRHGIERPRPHVPVQRHRP